MGAWVGLFLLGAYHGLNPGMGWLFAVALGLQEQRRAAVAKALAPMAIGHMLAVGATVGSVVGMGAFLPSQVLRLLTAVLLTGFGVYRLVRMRHPRWVGMRVGPGALIGWSFLVAWSHGAGLMLVPFLLGLRPTAHLDHPVPMPSVGNPWLEGIWAIGLHTAGYVAALGLAAWVVYEGIGLAPLRRLWINFDLLWAMALIATGLLTALL